jgi:AcrR family transcriptional regulator
MSVPATAPTRGRPRDPRRREAILRAAILLVAEVGYDRMTVDALAARAGVSKPTIYRRWPGGKPEIIAEAIRAKRAHSAELPDTGSLRGDLLAMLSAQISHMDQDAHLAGGMISQLRSSKELAQLFREEIVADERRRYKTLIARAVERGEIPADARITKLLPDVAGSIVFTRAAILGDPVDQAFLEELVDHVLLPILQAN